MDTRSPHDIVDRLEDISPEERKNYMPLFDEETVDAMKGATPGERGAFLKAFLAAERKHGRLGTLAERSMPLPRRFALFVKKAKEAGGFQLGATA
jgi:hypothetical protein